MNRKSQIDAFGATSLVLFAALLGFNQVVFGVGFGWLLLGEEIGLSILGPLMLVAVGIVLINRRPRAQVPQNV